KEKVKMTKKPAKQLKSHVLTGAFLMAAVVAAPLFAAERGDRDRDDDRPIRHVLLISIDGMHALDFSNCAKGISGVNGGQPYCPNLAELSETGVNYLQALAARPSDSFPGLVALITGATTRTAGTYYDVSYDRKLSPPTVTTPLGIVGGADLCPKFVG